MRYNAWRYGEAAADGKESEMKEQQEYRAGIYTRISADDGVTDRESNSITTQKQILTRYANEHGFRVVEYYADDTAILGLKSELQ